MNWTGYNTKKIHSVNNINMMILGIHNILHPSLLL